MKTLKISIPLFIVFLSVVSFQCTKQSFQSNNEDVGVEELLQKGEPIFIKDLIIAKDLNISELVAKAKMGGGREYAICGSVLVFENCTFEGDLTGDFREGNNHSTTSFLHPVRFIDCDFKRKVDFSECEFRSAVSFFRCTFYEEPSFQGASFRGKVAMRENHFFENTMFQDAVFHESVNFSKSVFHKDISFQNVHFNDRLLMHSIKILGYGDFTLMDCDRDFLFNYAECPGKLVFDHSFFRKRSEFISFNGNDLSMRSCDFYALKMDKSVLTGYLDLESSRFDKGDFQLENIEYEKIIGIN